MSRLNVIILCIALVILCVSCGSNYNIDKNTPNNITENQPSNSFITNVDNNNDKTKASDTKANVGSDSIVQNNIDTNQNISNNAKLENKNETNNREESILNSKNEEDNESNEKKKVWVVDNPQKIVKKAPIEYSSPDKSLFTQSYCDSNNIIHLRTVDGELELWQVTEETELLIGVDVIMGDVGRVTLMSGETIWLWGGYTAAYHYAETLDNYASFGNNGIMPGNYDCVDMVQKWTPVTVIPEQGHWEWQ